MNLLIMDFVDKRGCLNDNRSQGHNIKSYGRIEFSSPTKEIIKMFYNSPYINQDDCLAIIFELQELFYYYKMKQKIN